MRYAEDLRIGERTECASYSLSSEEIIRFAKLYDPNPFHLNEEGAKRSLFGRLCASGLHSATLTHRLALQHALADVHYLGSPGAEKMTMHQPLYPDVKVRVSHTIRAMRSFAWMPEIVLVESLTQGIDPAGRPVISIEDLSWVGSRNASPAAVSALTTQAALGPVCDRITMPAAAALINERVYFEDCPIGRIFKSPEAIISFAEAGDYHARYDPPAAENGVVFRNEWQAICLALRVAFGGFWRSLEVLGGPGTELMRWRRAIHPGERLHTIVTVREARPSQSRPGVGLARIETICANHLGEVVASYYAPVFLRMRAAATV